MAAMGGSELGWNRKEGIGCHDDRHYPGLAAIPGERRLGLEKGEEERWVLAKGIWWEEKPWGRASISRRCLLSGLAKYLSTST